MKIVVQETREGEFDLPVERLRATARSALNKALASVGKSAPELDVIEDLADLLSAEYALTQKLLLAAVAAKVCP